MAFKYPEKFGAVAVLEPAIEAAFHWVDLTESDTFYREDIYPTIFGDPIDPRVLGSKSSYGHRKCRSALIG